MADKKKVKNLTQFKFKKFEWLIQISLLALFLYLIARYLFLTNTGAFKEVFSGRYFYNKSGRRWPGREFSERVKNIQYRGLFYLVLLRLSPFLPFGLLNLSLGYSKTPLSVYLMSTFVGVFLDVVLFNKIGASIRDLKETSFDDYFLITSFFIILFLFVLLISSKKMGQLVINTSHKNES